LVSLHTAKHLTARQIEPRESPNGNEIMSETVELLQQGVPEAQEMPAPGYVPGPRRLEPAPSEEHLRRMKFAYTARGARRRPPGGLLTGDVAPRAGDIVVARVDELGQHKRLELKTGRRANLFPGDEIVVCYGSRYAPDQFEAHVPGDLGPCQLVAAGGLAGRMVNKHVRMDEPTQITPLGLLARPDGSPLNIADWSLGPPPAATPGLPRPLTLAVIGSSMNAGKTTTAANLVRGLVASGRRVGAAKITGTGAGGDVWFLSDSGANPALDFTSVGLPSTYEADPEVVVGILDRLHGHLVAAGAEAIVLEIADGVFQAETAALLRSPRFAATIDGMLFAATDALGATAAADHLGDVSVPLLAISGLVTASPLGVRETVQATHVPVVDIAALREPEPLAALLDRVRPRAEDADAGLRVA